MPWLTLMGFRSTLLFAVPLLLATPALAQEQQDGAEPVFNLPRTQPQTPADKQGPELDVFRSAPTPVTPPPLVLPTIPVQPTPAPAPPPQQQPVGPATPAQQQTPRLQAPQPAARPAPATGSAPITNEAAPTAPAPQAVPAPEAQPPAAEPPPAPAPLPGQWPWIAAGTAALAALLGAIWLLRRRNRPAEESYAEPEVEDAPVAPAPRPVPPKAKPPAPTAPAPAAPEPTLPPAASTDRPWLEIDMEVQAARLTLMGATIGYVLTLHNSGTRAAQDILVRSLIANADAQQQALFQQFFAGSTGMPVHSAVSIAPGETQRLTGELRLGSEEIATIQMGHRALLIPLIAFDAQYRWTDGEAEGTGRTGRAFIVGQEQSPPVERLSPFRLDLGPRQYRTPGSRATALTLAS